ncbi:glutathione S-transferase [Sugiyamaella lignohabitans]|uniref:Glutathione S-transferase n=1 Tax=Sugiyamaella lignohabitans TaxID=796027 RepID=A0A167C861_9ASCO|nr:glutathione S-transferase [Sugiyamaella lignohabitans]ANB11343.1 glutathione S-transferase [Sugiyamaella lignohabitans]
MAFDQKLKLFYLPGACSLNPHIILHEAKFPNVEYVKVGRNDKGQFTVGNELLTDVNPKGRVPALVLENGHVMTEGSIIVQYLASLAPEAKLLPQEGQSKWDALELLNFCASDLHKSVGTLFKPYASDEFKQAHKAGEVARNLKYINELLSKNEYLFGSEFTAIDSYAYTCTRWAVNLKVDFSEYPNITAWQKRMEARPSVKKALEEEGIPLLFP